MLDVPLYTLNGAFAGFEEDVKRSITPGKLADMVVLADEPMSVDLMTISSGRTVHEG